MSLKELERRIDTLENEKSTVIRTWFDLMKYCDDPNASLSTEMEQLVRGSGENEL